MICEANGGKLLEPKSQKITDEIRQLVNGQLNSNQVWIGINDINEEGKYIYASDGSPVTWLNWNNKKSRGHPDNKENEDCIVMEFHWNGTWNNISCDNEIKMEFICESTTEKTPQNSALTYGINMILIFAEMCFLHYIFM